MTDVLYNSVIALLNCSMCKRKVNSPVAVCVNGHITCINCERRTIVCFLCKCLFMTKKQVLINTILEATQNREHFLEALSLSLECPVCYNQITTYVICKNGHGVCRTCSIFTHHCPLCREYYHLFKYSFVIDSLLELLKKRINCVNWSHCKTSCLYSDLLDHEVKCNQSFCYCIMEDCDWKGTMLNLAFHVDKRHPWLIIDENNFTTDFILKNELNTNYMFRSHEKAFWLKFQKMIDEALLVAVQIHDLQSNYKVQIGFKTKNLELKFIQDILTIKENMDLTNGGSSKCLLIPKEISAKLLGDKSTKCAVKILEQNFTTEKSQDNSLVHKIMISLFLLNLLLFCTKTAN